MIKLDDVSLILNNTKIIENVSFKVGKGEFVFLLGPSGAGKSSILNLIHFDVFPTLGEVIVQGENTRKVPKRKIPFLRRSIGFIFQDYKLLKEKTTFENVAFALEVTGTKRKVVKQKALHALNTVGLSHRLGHYPGDLSGGECQRVAIARAIVLEPFILLADEPTGDLDDENSWAILELLEKINHSGTAIIMATHKSELSGQGASRVVKIAGGRIV
ncbi:MAG TPA: ATP-binding cassette domain-containing protein [bacterium]|nr:ATP-binding cassette domain-containing protein [bacterium]